MMNLICCVVSLFVSLVLLQQEVLQHFVHCERHDQTSGIEVPVAVVVPVVLLGRIVLGQSQSLRIVALQVDGQELAALQVGLQVPLRVELLAALLTQSHLPCLCLAGEGQ